MSLMDTIPSVIPGLSRDQETAADRIPASAGMTNQLFCFCMSGY